MSYLPLISPRSFRDYLLPPLDNLFYLGVIRNGFSHLDAIRSEPVFINADPDNPVFNEKLYSLTFIVRKLSHAVFAFLEIGGFVATVYLQMTKRNLAFFLIGTGCVILFTAYLEHSKPPLSIQNSIVKIVICAIFFSLITTLFMVISLQLMSKALIGTACVNLFDFYLQGAEQTIYLHEYKKCTNEDKVEAEKLFQDNCDKGKDHFMICINGKKIRINRPLQSSSGQLELLKKHDWILREERASEKPTVLKEELGEFGQKFLHPILKLYKNHSIILGNKRIWIKSASNYISYLPHFLHKRKSE